MPWESRYTRDELAEAVRTSKTTAEVLRKVGLVPRGGNYEWIRTRFARWNIDASHLQRYASRRLEQVWDFSDADIARAVEKSPSLAAAMRELGRKKSAAGYRYLHEAIQRLELDTSHMTGSAWSRGRSLPQSRKPLS